MTQLKYNSKVSIKNSDANICKQKEKELDYI